MTSFLSKLKMHWESFLAKSKIHWESLRARLNNEFSKEPAPKPDINKKDLDFANDAKTALMAEQIPFISGLLYVLVALFIIGLLWAKLSVVEEVTVGVGKVIPSTHIKEIQSLEGGILAELLVKEGETVYPNQVVARLNVSDAEAEYLSSQNHYFALLATFARLKAEATDQSTIQFPPEIAHEKDLINNETQLFLSRKKELNEKLKTLIESQDLTQKQLNITTPLVYKGIVSKLELLQLKSALNTIKGSIQDEKNKFSKESLTDLNNTADELRSLKEKMQGLKQRIVRSTIRSPVHGVVKQIDNTTIGGVIKPGGDIMQIVPLEDTLLIEARVSPKDIAFISPGQQATVKFTAYDYSIYGGLKGKVEYISADSVVDQKGDTYYLVQIRTNRSYLGTAQKPLPIIPGMVTTVDIITGKKSIADYLLKPFLKAKYEALRER